MLYRRIVKHQDQQFGLILSSHIFVFDVSIDWNKKGCWSIQLQFKAFEKETARMTALPDMEIMNLGMINLNYFYRGGTICPLLLRDLQRRIIYLVRQ